MPLIIMMVHLATEGRWSVTLLKVPYSGYWWRFLELECVAMGMVVYVHETGVLLLETGSTLHFNPVYQSNHWAVSYHSQLVSVFFGRLLLFSFAKSATFHHPPPKKKKKEEEERRNYIILPNFWLALPLNSSVSRSRTHLQKIQNHAAHLTFSHTFSEETKLASCCRMHCVSVCKLATFFFFFNIFIWTLVEHFISANVLF